MQIVIRFQTVAGRIFASENTSHNNRFAKPRNGVAHQINLHPFPLNAMLNWGSVSPLAKFLPIERPLTKQIKDDTPFQH